MIEKRMIKMKGFKWTDEQKKNLSKIKKGKAPKNLPQLLSIDRRGDKNPTKRPEVAKKISEANKGKFTGEKHWNWKGGLTPLVRQIRRCFKYRQWRSEIFKKDDYSCILCNKRGGWVEADHYPKSFSDIFYRNKIKTIWQALDCKELWDMNNGRTLCRKCHNETKKKSY